MDSEAQMRLQAAEQDFRGVVDDTRKSVDRAKQHLRKHWKKGLTPSQMDWYRDMQGHLREIEASLRYPQTHLL